MSIETTHRGYKVTYAENEDVWRCWDLEEDAPTLSGIKRKIDKHDRARRATTELIPALYLNEYQGVREVSIHLLAEAPSDARHREHSGKVWVYTAPGANKAREKVELKNLAALQHPDTAGAIKALETARAELKEAQAKAKAAFEAVPRFTYETLSALLPVSDK